MNDEGRTPRGLDISFGENDGKWTVILVLALVIGVAAALSWLTLAAAMAKGIVIVAWGVFVLCAGKAIGWVIRELRS